MTELYERNQKRMSPVWSRIFSVEVERGEGSYLYDTDGRRFLDFTCGIGATSTGHCHPAVVAAIREQAGLILHAQANIAVHRPMLNFIEELRNILPLAFDGLFFSNSGAEAVEAAIKLSRAASGRQNIIVFSGSFHGRTAATMALTTSKAVYKAPRSPACWSRGGSISISIEDGTGRGESSCLCAWSPGGYPYIPKRARRNGGHSH